MDIPNFIRGLQIIESARPKEKPLKKSPYHGRPEHDQFWAGSLEWPFTVGQIAELEQLGWQKDEDADGWLANF